ncbi:MAG: sialidase family protein [Anaerolineae bacterium]|nr:glycoside hydrolase [Candidatus Roseilinea sp.]MDW8451505.1 sialidase family protein [Anaerolineae bacterium]
MEHVVVYRERGRFAGWPANYGMWSWGDELVVGFTVGVFKAGAGFHAKVATQPFVTMQARSLDSGATWHAQPMPCRTPGGRALSADEHVVDGLKVAETLQGDDAPQPCPGDVDFTQPDFALLCARSGLAAGAVSWFYLSTDRCRSWRGPYALPMFGQAGVAARTDAVVLGSRSLLLLLTAAKPNGEEGRVFVARTDDGGRTFRFVAWVTPAPEGYTIMPATVRLASGRLVTAVRCAGPLERVGPYWIDVYASDDEGESWRWMGTPVRSAGAYGNPSAMTLLSDGRLCLTYGRREAPFGIRARLSADGGATWGAEIVLRADGGDPDLGYPRTAQRSDGALVTVYYFNDRPDGERYIGATIWQPPDG